MVRATAFDHVGVVSIKGEESIGEFAHIKTTITRAIITGNEKFELFTCWEDADGGEALAELRDGDISTVVHIKDLEGICEVEVGLQSQRDLFTLNFVLIADKFSQAVN